MFNIKVIRKILLGVLIASVAGALVSLGYTYYINQKLKALPQVYVYQTYWGPANPVLFVYDEDDQDDLISYYQQVEKGENPTFNFDLHTHATGVPVYLVEYSRDSLIAEIISTRDGYARFYVYGKTVHLAPPDSTMKKNNPLHAHTVLTFRNVPGHCSTASSEAESTSSPRPPE